MTHSFDQSQRCVVLFDGESRGDGATVTGPRDRFVAPPGDYMLFVLRRVDVGSDAVLVPSVARMVKVAERADRYASTRGRIDRVKGGLGMLGELPVVEQRYLAVREALDAAKITDVATRGSQGYLTRVSGKVKGRNKDRY
jgi:hypothetical protein